MTQHNTAIYKTMNKHYTIAELGGGYVRLTPDEGYVLIKDNDTSRHFSDAEVKETEVGRWSAIKK